jgi:hypothetical protein
MIRDQKSADIVGGCFFALLGLVVLVAATQITGGLEERLPPRTLPYVLGFTLFISGALLAIKSWRFRGENPLIKWPDRPGLVRVVVTLLSLAIYCFSIDYFGMPLSTVLYIASQVWYLREGKHRLLYAALTGLISGGVVYYLFMRVLELNFPMGLLQG